jgi:DNA helicase-2/ATP-dependent DNA helicase PcrA
VVFLPGLEEGIFPGMQSSAIPEELEEERRLAYVAITRAKTKLYMTYVHERMLFGRSQYNKPSRFVGEISKENADFGLTYKEKMEQNREAQRKAVESARKPYSKIPPAPMKKPTQKQDINVGDIVEHVMFGKGDVMSVTKMGADILYEIAFETVGTKKLMGSYVKLKKL